MIIYLLFLITVYTKNNWEDFQIYTERNYRLYLYWGSGRTNENFRSVNYAKLSLCSCQAIAGGHGFSDF